MRTFWPLDDFEIYTISLFQRSVAVTRNVGVMDENVRTVISPDKAVAPGIYEPLHLALHLHTYCSQRYARAASKASADWHFPNNSFLSCSFFACSRGCMRVLKNDLDLQH